MALAIGASALLAACNGGGSSSSSSGTTTTTTTTTTIAASTTTTAGAPCGGTATVEAAVRHSTVAGLNQVSDKYDVRNVSTAASDPTWARFEEPPKAGVTDFQGGYGVAHCESGAWVVTDVGTDQVGCPGGTIPPPPLSVRRDLVLHCAGE